MAIAAMLGVAVAAPAAAEGPLRAGAAALDVTPFLDDPIVGNFTTPPASYVHDPLHARALVLDDGETKLAFVIVDSVGVTRGVFDAARKLIVEKTGISAGNILAAATHTHSATSGRSKDPFGVDDPPTEYQRLLARRLADAVRLALGNLAPAEIGWGSVDAPEHLFNRRWLIKEGETVPSPFGGEEHALMNPGRNPKIDRPAGGTDPQVSFLAVRTPEGRPVALLANYSLHYVGGVPNGHVSGDYFAVFARKIGERLGADPLNDPPFVGIMSNGTSGDVNNIDIMGAPPKKPFGPYEKMTLVAEDLAGRVAGAYESVAFQAKVKLGAASRELVLKRRRPTPEQVAYAREILAKPEDAPKHHGLERVFAERTLGMVDTPEETSVMLQAFRIGDLGIAAIPFEVFTETGLDIKARSPFQPTFTIELANGSYGYLPTPRHFALGGYETWLGVNRVEPEASEKIVATLLDLFSTLK
jgi:hypothetical protein